MNPTISDRGTTDSRQHAPGIILGEIALTATLPQATGWLPPGASRPPAGRKESGILDLRRIDEQCQLSFWHQDGGLLWQDNADDRNASEALARRVFGIDPKQWRPAQIPSDYSGAAAPLCRGQPLGRSFTVTRLTDSGAWAMWIGILLFSILVLGGMFGSMRLGEYLQVSEGWQTTLSVVGILVSMIVALIASFGLPFWIQNRFFGQDELHATSPLAIAADGITLDVLGHLPWAALNAIDQVNTESGEPEAVILLSDAWGKLMFRAAGSHSNIALAEKLLDALLTYWRPGDDPSATNQAPTIFRLLPIRRWWHETLNVLGVAAGVAVFFAIMAHSGRGFFGTLLAAFFLAFLTWAMVALMPQHFWSLTSANRVRTFLFLDKLLSDNSGRIRFDLSQATVEYIYWRCPALAMDYLLIRAPGMPALRLAAFDAGWSEFVAAVRERAEQWKDDGPQETYEAFREFRG